MPGQFRQLEYERFERRTKLVLWRTPHGIVCQFPLRGRTKIRNDVRKFGHNLPRGSDAAFSIGAQR